MKNYLIISATSVVGQAIIKAIHEYHAEKKTDYYITASTSQNKDIENVHKTIYNIDFSKSDSSKALAGAVLSIPEVKSRIDFMFYTPARGAVGFTYNEAKKQDIKKSMDFSLRPILELQKTLNPKRSVGFSGLLWMPTLCAFYGSMLCSKIALEILAEKYLTNFQVLRIGFFNSKSSRAIIVMTCRNIVRGLYPKTFSNWPTLAKKEGKTLSNFILDTYYKDEKDVFAKHSKLAHKKTTLDDIKNSIKKILITGDDINFNPILNIIGNVHWEEKTISPLWPSSAHTKAEILCEEMFKEIF